MVLRGDESGGKETRKKGVNRSRVWQKMKEKETQIYLKDGGEEKRGY